MLLRGCLVHPSSSLRPGPANFLKGGADAYFILGDRECRAIIEWMKPVFEGIILAQSAIFDWSELLPNHTVQGGHKMVLELLIIYTWSIGWSDYTCLWR